VTSLNALEEILDATKPKERIVDLLRFDTIEPQHDRARMNKNALNGLCEAGNVVGQCIVEGA